jgi:hypothetical protein
MVMDDVNTYIYMHVCVMLEEFLLLMGTVGWLVGWLVWFCTLLRSYTQ